MSAQHITRPLSQQWDQISGSHLEECPYCVGVQSSLCSPCSGTGKTVVTQQAFPVWAEQQEPNPPF